MHFRLTSTFQLCTHNKVKALSIYILDNVWGGGGGGCAKGLAHIEITTNMILKVATVIP